MESHAAERRRALHELDERMRRRERELMERIQREEAEAAQRIHAGFEDVQRRQIEQLERIVERATATYSDDAAQQVRRALAEDGARADATTALERRRDERLGALDERIHGLEADIRRRLEDLGADAEAERAVIEARLQELLRRVESAGALQST